MCAHEKHSAHREGKINWGFLSLIAAAFFFAGALYTDNDYLYLAVYFLVGLKIAYEAFFRLFQGEIFNEELLMTVAAVGAFLIREYPEGAAVMLFYTIGELLENRAVAKSVRTVDTLLKLRPDHANVSRGGETLSVDPGEVRVGETVIVYPGERVPLDGELLSPIAALDASALTGESVFREETRGGKILSGSINQQNIIEIKVTAPFSESSSEKILRLVRDAQSRKAKTERFIGRFAAVYTPVVVSMAVLLAVVPPLFGGGFSQWFHRALVFLVASCPCALVISVPLTFVTGIGLASKNGILIKGGNFIETLARVSAVAFDKTGTLTEGKLEITGITARNGVDENELLRLVAHCEHYSAHPIGRTVSAGYGGEIDVSAIRNFKEYSGGVSAEVNGKKIRCARAGVFGLEENDGVTALYVEADGEIIGSLLFSDLPKPDAKETISALLGLGINSVILSGDNFGAVKNTAERLGVREYYSGLLPAQKLDKIREMGAVTAFAGDGINDAPALSGSAVGIAMGGVGRDAALEAADVVIMSDRPRKIADAVLIARKTLQTARLNTVLILLIKMGVLILGALGLVNMWAAVFADVGVTLIAVAISVSLYYRKF